jgi:putative DNA primase/helicase
MSRLGNTESIHTQFSLSYTHQLLRCSWTLSGLRRKGPVLDRAWQRLSRLPPAAPQMVGLASLHFAGAGRAASVGRAVQTCLARLPQDDGDRTARALALWQEAETDHPLLHEYLAGRGVELPLRALGEAVRFHPRCPWGGGKSVAAMVCLVRDVRTNAPQAIHRTRLLDDDGKLWLRGKGRKKALGPIGGGAIKLSDDADVTLCLGIAEGIETALTMRRTSAFGPSPVWSLISKEGIRSLPPLPAIECLWIGVDHDANGEGQVAAEACAKYWQADGREVHLLVPKAKGADLNDLAPERRYV